MQRFANFMRFLVSGSQVNGWNRQHNYRPWSTWTFKAIGGFGVNFRWFSFSGSAWVGSAMG